MFCMHQKKGWEYYMIQSWNPWQNENPNNDVMLSLLKKPHSQQATEIRIHQSGHITELLFIDFVRFDTEVVNQISSGTWWPVTLRMLKKISSYLSRCISITLPDHPTCILPFKHGLEAPGVKEYLKTNRRLGPKGFNSQPLKGGDDCFFMFVYHIAKMEQICVYIY